MAETEKELKEQQEGTEEAVSEGETAENEAAESEAKEKEEAAAEDKTEAKEAEAAEGEESSKRKKVNLFGKKENKELAKLKEQVETLNDQMLRQRAEFENFRKRTEKEKQAMYEVGARSVIEKLLPIVDNFERGIAVLTEDEGKTPFADGMQKVYKQMMEELDKLEVKPIEAVGKEFDPNIHNAVMHVEDESVGENVIVEEFQKGYMYRETVVRHSMVKVAN